MGGVVKGLGAITLGLGAIGAASVREFGKFDLGMARLQTVLPAGANAMEQFGEGVKRRAVEFGTSIANVSDAMFEAVSAGVPEKEVENFADVVGMAARGGFTEMSTVVDGLTTIINAYGLEAADATKVSDAFFTANRLGKTTFEQISSSIGRVAPAAKALGVSYNELLAATISMTKGGVKTSEVMSSLKAVFGNVKQPSEKAAELAKDLGLQFDLAALKSKGLGAFLEDLIRKTKGNTLAQAELFGSMEAFNAIARLTSDQGLKEFNNGMKELKEATGETKRAFEGVEGTVGFKLQQIKSSMGRFAVEIGAGLVEGLGLDKIENIPDAVEKAAVTVRNSAKAFAQGFSEAFAPLQATAAFDWAGLAKTLGSAAGNLVNAFLKLAEIIGGVLASQGFKDLMFVTGAVLGGDVGIGEGKSEEAIQKRHGGTASVFRVSQPVIARGGQVGFSTISQSQLRREAIRQLRSEVSIGVTGSEGLEHLTAGGEIREGAIRARKARVAAEEFQAQIRFVQGRREARRKGQAIAEKAQREKTMAGIRAQKEQNIAAAERGRKFVGAIATGAENAWNVVINWENSIKVKDKKSKKGGGFSARGRGDAVIQSTSEQMYLLTENQIVPMSDEFHFAKLLAEVGS